MRLSWPAVILTAICATVIVGFSLSSGEPEQSARFQQSKDWKGCGVEKLSHEELQNLLTLARSCSNTSFLDQSMHQYMLKQGWLRTEVLGYYQKQTSVNATPEEWIAMYRGGRTYLLDPPLSARRLDPGVYWTKGNASTWDLLNEDGSVESFYWVKESW